VNEERATFYTGPRSWLVSAAISLFGTTSGVCSILVGKSLELHLPYWIQSVIVWALGFFYAAGMWMSVLGGGSLIRGSTEEVGSWTLWGRPVSKRAWKAVLAICYLAPWIGIAWFVLRVLLTA